MNLMSIMLEGMIFMDGNYDSIQDESEKQNNFWAYVYYFMQENKCNEQTAIKVIEPLYRKESFRNKLYDDIAR